MASITERRLGSRFGWLAAAIMLLLLAACGGSRKEDFPPVSVVVDESRASPLPQEDAASGSVDATYAPLDLSALGDNVAASALPADTPAGLQVGFTEEGFPYRGDPDAPVTLIEYSDYACPFCGRHTATTAPELLAQYGLTGRVRFVFREFPLPSLHPTAPAAHIAAWCSGEQSARLYWDMHDAIFAGQADWTDLTDPGPLLRNTAEALGADMSAFDDCVASGRAEGAIATGSADASERGFTGTPSFEIMGNAVAGTFNIVGAQPIDVFRGYIDSLLTGVAPGDRAPEPGTEPETTLPYWADVGGGLRPDPTRPGVNLAGDHYKGDPEAKLVVIEFSDFQCPFCRDHALEVQPAIDAEFVDTGEVLWVYKHLPLSIHPLAPAAAAAAECAGDQGQFFEMHHLLFAAVSRWTQGDMDAEMVALAAELGLDTAAFEGCYEGRDALERVLADLADVGGIISSTPSFVYIAGDSAALQQGSLPLDQFLASLRGRVEQAAGA